MPEIDTPTTNTASEIRSVHNTQPHGDSAVEWAGVGLNISPTIGLFDPTQDVSQLVAVAEAAFGEGPDSKLEEWFSFSEMTKAIQEGRGACVTATNESGDIIGLTYAQQESPINGREGREKWVIVLAAVDPEESGRGVGSQLLKGIEKQAVENGAKKMFVYTNEGDERVINFYRKNGYEDAGAIRNYQYGDDNSAVFLLKNLGK